MQLIIDFNTMGIVQACKGDSRKIKTLITSVADALNSIAEAFAKLDEQPEKGSKTEKSDQKVQKSERKEQKSEQKPEKVSLKEPTEVKFVPIPSAAPKKKRSQEAQRAIDSIKEAYAKKKAEIMEEQKPDGRGRKLNIDNSLIVYMHEEQNKDFKAIAKELGCCEQTVANRYKKAKEDKK